MLLSVPKTQYVCSQKNEFAAFGSKYLPIQKNIFVNVFVFTHSKISLVPSQKTKCAAFGLKYPSIQKTIFHIFKKG